VGQTEKDLEYVVDGRELGRRIRWLRLEDNLTLVQLEERCGVPRSTISRIERGGWPMTDDLIALCEAFGLTPNDLLAFSPSRVWLNPAA
jgi:transcriptional regulator with XRE-family HTH domain